ncbi:asparagine synthetase B [Virgisporangium aliadipatigenens]|uniref:asparagine synthase (glutamine-hydrolyzing) n=1 Tax=Virgisporangium aliadipatigenens TaxID=741659 RepID=A0A8J3YG95_9ACTN|nr:asparagine synthetase B family protein [Virgisporangium aliadipatigenens]GIJ44491.1 asparagine synthetase B [Virgisporangium aliadipatigenens]
MARFLVTPASIGLLPAEPGHATGPVEVDGLRAVGEVTLHNRASLPGGADDCSDLELLVRLYRRAGAAGLRDVEGMFVVAARDGADLVLIRDHVGARTAFYAHGVGGWTAGTSLRALREGRGLNLAAVRSFLTFAYLPGEETLIEGVRELLPGRCLRLSPDGGTREEVFWEPVEGTPADGDPVQVLRTLLEKATVRRLPAGGPVAVLLSGGIDSSLVTALAAKLHDHPVHTYSISFGTDLPNELAYSGLVATHCHTRHRVLNVSGTAVASRLAETVALLDSPVGDPLTVPNLMLAEAVAADGHDMLLNGEGGDPVFGGPKNLPMLIFELHREDPDPGARAAAYLRSYRKCLADLPVLLTPEVRHALRDAPPLERFVAPYLNVGMESLLNRLLHVNLRTKGAHHILTKVERLTAARGLQGRSPLFDRAVIDHAFAVPPTLKLAGTVEKWILKEAVRDLLPHTIVDRPKSGMRVPVQQWLDGPLRDLTHEVLLGRGGSGLFRPETIRAWVRREGTLLPRQGGKLWLVLTLELWLRSYGLSL